MSYFKITFENGDSLITGFNGSLKDANHYYLGECFELDENQPMVQAVKVERL